MFLAAENHYLGGIHAHGLIKWQRNFLGKHPYYRDVWQKWFNKYGRGRFVRPRGPAAAAYCAKYVTKRDLDWRILGDPLKLPKDGQDDTGEPQLHDGELRTTTTTTGTTSTTTKGDTGAGSAFRAPDSRFLRHREPPQLKNRSRRYVTLRGAGYGAVDITCIMSIT